MSTPEAVAGLPLASRRIRLSLGMFLLNLPARTERPLVVRMGLPAVQSTPRYLPEATGRSGKPARAALRARVLAMARVEQATERGAGRLLDYLRPRLLRVVLSHDGGQAVHVQAVLPLREREIEICF